MQIKLWFYIIYLGLILGSVLHSPMSSAQLENALSCRNCTYSSPEHRHSDEMLKRYYAGDLSAQEIEDLIFTLNLSGAPYQAAIILESEITSKNRLHLSRDYLKLNDLYIKAREDELGYKVLERALKDVSKYDLRYSQIVDRLKTQKRKLKENDPKHIKAEIYENSPLRELEEHTLNFFEQELCYQKIKQAYDADVTAFRLDDRNCLKYLPDYVKSVRFGHNLP